MNYPELLFDSTNRSSKTTLNGAISYGETNSGILDFFSNSGALRDDPKKLINLLGKALSEDISLSLKALFYMRDIRGGQGERENFREALIFLANKFPKEISRNIKYISEFGRWDDLYSFVGTNLQDLALDIIKDQFVKDVNSLTTGNEISILAKWLKSENTSSKESKKLATITRKYLELTSSKYRKLLSSLRKKISIVETKMSQNKWSEIDYSKVPSQASRIYSNSFRNHDTEQYNLFIEKVKLGEEKINAKTLYPYDIIKKFYKNPNLTYDERNTYDVLWKSLPNYMEKEENSIVVVDVSPSMTGDPVCVSISLGIYFAEKNTGPFKDYCITFSDRPTMIKIQGTDIFEKYKNLIDMEWGGSTNLQAVFDLILNTAVKNNIQQKELPKKVYIISDMQFDIACKKNNKTNLENIKLKFKKVGYEAPQLVFWNVHSYGDAPSTKNEKDVFLVSGCSPSILKNAINSISITPFELMLQVLNSERYSIIN